MENDKYATATQEVTAGTGCSSILHPVSECGPATTTLGDQIREMENQKRRDRDATCAKEAYSDPTMTADQEARRMVRNVTRNVDSSVASLQNKLMELHYLTALFDALPSKMSYEAAQGLKILLRNYPS